MGERFGKKRWIPVHRCAKWMKLVEAETGDNDLGGVTH
jgi:hypothetical protein